MGFFIQNGTIELDAEPSGMPGMVAAIERLIDYTGGEITGSAENKRSFRVPPFIFAGRTKPLARLSHGEIELHPDGDDKVEIRYRVRTSNVNVVASFVIIAIVTAIAVLALREGQTTDPLVFALVLALGPLFAFTLVHQSVSRFARELKDACLLGASYGHSDSPLH